MPSLYKGLEKYCHLLVVYSLSGVTEAQTGTCRMRVLSMEHSRGRKHESTAIAPMVFSLRCPLLTLDPRQSNNHSINIQKRRDLLDIIADSFRCTAETNNIVRQLYSNKNLLKIYKIILQKIAIFKKKCYIVFLLVKNSP